MLPSTRGAEVLWRTFVQPMYRQMAGRVNAQTPVTGYATNTASFERMSTSRCDTGMLSLTFAFVPAHRHQDFVKSDLVLLDECCLDMAGGKERI